MSLKDLCLHNIKQQLDECFINFYGWVEFVYEEMITRDIKSILFDGEKYVCKTHERTEENQFYFNFIIEVGLKHHDATINTYVNFDIKKLNLYIKEFLIQHDYLETVARLNRDIPILYKFKSMDVGNKSIHKYYLEIKNYILENCNIDNIRKKYKFLIFVTPLNNKYQIYNLYKYIDSYERNIRYMTNEHKKIYYQICNCHKMFERELRNLGMDISVLHY